MADQQIEAPEVDNVYDDVRAAVAELKGETPAPLASSEDVSSVSDDGVDRSATPPTDDPRPRNERGQFIKADGTVDVDQRPASAKSVSDADPATVNDASPSTASNAPSSWSAEAKAEFTKLPPAVQQAALKREAEMESGRLRWSEERQNLVSILEPVRAAADRYQAHPGEVVKRLAAANEYLERDPAGAIKWLADAYGVDLSKPLNEQSTPQRQADPVLRSLSEKVSNFERIFQQQEQNRTAETLQSFATQPGREHFEAVRADMGRLMLAAMQAGQELSLQDAYDRAVWANPDTRTKMLASQNAGALAAQKQKETADKARRGAISVNGAPNGHAAPTRTAAPNGTSAVDDVRAALEQLRH